MFFAILCIALAFSAYTNLQLQVSYSPDTTPCTANTSFVLYFTKQGLDLNETFYFSHT
jgi:hypothetical protein